MEKTAMNIIEPWTGKSTEFAEYGTSQDTQRCSVEENAAQQLHSSPAQRNVLFRFPRFWEALPHRESQSLMWHQEWHTILMKPRYHQRFEAF